MSVSQRFASFFVFRSTIRCNVPDFLGVRHEVLERCYHFLCAFRTGRVGVKPSRRHVAHDKRGRVPTSGLTKLTV